MDEEIIDPSTEGVGGLSGLKGLSASEKADQIYKELGADKQGIRAIKGTQDYSAYQDEVRQRHTGAENIGFAGINDSRLDTDITSETQLNNLDNFRGEDQGGINQLASGVAKGVVLAASTFLDGTIGTIVGLGNLAAGAAQGDMKGSDFWNNPFSRAMQSVNEWSEKAIPNYYTDKEKSEPWYDNIFSTNFLGDKVIKNFGFAVGAMYAGNIASGVLSKAANINKIREAFKGATLAANGVEGLGVNQVINAYREGKTALDGVQLTTELAKDAAKINRLNIGLKTTGSLVAASGEAKIEALNNSKDFREMEMKNLDAYRDQELNKAKEAYISAHKDFSDVAIDENGQYYLKLKPQYEQQVKDEVERNIHYKQAQGKIIDDALKMGNVDFVLNMGLLGTSDMVQWGKSFAGGFNTAKKAMVKKVEGQVAKGIKETVGEEGKRIFVAGAEKAASYVAEGSSKFGVLGKALQNATMEGTEEQLQQVAADLSGNKYASDLNSFYGKKINPDSEKESISWLKATSDAMLKNYGKVDGWENFAIGFLTGAVGTPGFRSMKNAEGEYQSPMTFEGGIKGEYKEAEKERENNEQLAKQLTDRVQSPEFLNYYQHLIRDKSYEKDKETALKNDDNFEYKNAEHGQLISDVVMFNKAGRIQDLYDMIEGNSKITPEDAESVKTMMTDKSTKESPYDDKLNVDGKNESVEFIQKKAKETKEAIDKYRKIADDIQVKYGDKLSTDGVEEMTYMLSHVDNLEGRFKSLMEDTHKKLNIYKDNINQQFDPQQKENIDLLLNSSPSDLLSILSNPENKTVVDQLDFLGRELTRKIPALKLEGLEGDMEDLSKIMDKRNDLINSLTTYMNTPQILTEKLSKLKEKVLTEEEVKAKKEQKDKLISSKNIQEYRKNLNEVSDENKDVLIEELSKEKHRVTKEYRDVESYNKDVNQNIEDSDAPEDVKNTAKHLFKGQYDNSNTLQELANHNSVHLTENSDNYLNDIYDENLPEDVQRSHLVNAQYHLFKAIHDANNSKTFASRFTEDYKKLKEVSFPVDRRYSREDRIELNRLIKKEQNTKSIQKVIDKVKFKIEKAKNHKIQIESTIQYHEDNLEEISKSIQKEEQILSKKLDKAIKDFESKPNTRSENKLNKIKEQYKTLFNLSNDIQNRISELKESLRQTEDIQKDLENKINFYKNLLADATFKTLSTDELQNRQKIISKKLGVVNRLIDNLKGGIKSLFNLLKDITNVLTSDSKVEKNLKENINEHFKQSDISIIEIEVLKKELNTLENRIISALDHGDLYEELYNSKKQELDNLIKKSISYQNNIRYIDDLLGEMLNISNDKNSSKIDNNIVDKIENIITQNNNVISQNSENNKKEIKKIINKAQPIDIDPFDESDLPLDPNLIEFLESQESKNDNIGKDPTPVLPSVKVENIENKKADIERRREEANNKNEEFWEQFTAINAEEVADRDNLINKLIKDIQLPPNTRINDWSLEELVNGEWVFKKITNQEEYFGKENWDKIKEAKEKFDIEFKKIENSNLAKIKLIEQKQSDLLSTVDGLELRKAWSFGLIEEPNIVGLDETNFISKETELKRNGDLVETDNYEGYYYLSKPDEDGEWYEQIIGKTEKEVENKINAKYDAELNNLKLTAKPPPINSDIKDEFNDEEKGETFNDLSDEEQAKKIIDEAKKHNQEEESKFDLGDYRLKQLLGGEPRPYIRPAVPEVHIEESKKGDFRNWDEVIAEKAKDPDSDEIEYRGPNTYNYLKKAGAFDYVNEGKLKEGDTVGFVIDPSFSDKIILMVSTKDNQVIGSIDQDTSVYHRFIGLRELVDKVFKEYKSFNGKGQFIATPTTKVSQIMLGKLPYTSTTNNLQSLFKDKEKDVKFAIVKKGQFDTNVPLDLGIITPKNLEGKEGLVYILIKNARGKYSPMGVRSKELSDLSIEDIINNNGYFQSEINTLLNKIINSKGGKKLEDLISTLKQDLYMKDIYISYNEDSSKGNNLRIHKYQRDDKGDLVKKVNEDGTTSNVDLWSERIYLETPVNDDQHYVGEGQINTPIKRDPNLIKKEILSVLSENGVKVQVNLTSINKGNYNEGLVKSGNLVTNLSKPETISSWFTLQTIKPDNTLGDAFKFDFGPETVNRKEAPKKVKDPINTNRVPVNLRGVEYEVDMKTHIIRKEGKAHTSKLLEEQKIFLFDLAHANHQYPNGETEGVNMIDNKIIAASGDILDRTTQTYLYGKEAQEVVDRIESRNNPKKKSVDQSLDTQSELEKINREEQVINAEFTGQGTKIEFEIEKNGNKALLIIGRNGNIEFLDGINKYGLYIASDRLYSNEQKQNIYNKYLTKDIKNSISNWLNSFKGSWADINSKDGKEYDLAEKQLINELQKYQQKRNELNNPKPQISQEDELEGAELIDGGYGISEEDINNSETVHTFGEDIPKTNDLDFDKISTNIYDESEEDLPEFREVDNSIKYEKWDQEKELNWLSKVLPQLSQQDLIKIQSGLIHSASQGTVAWGTFKDGVVTLSDIAAKGTVYHEAFRAVFNILLNPQEQSLLLEEAKLKYGNLSDKELKTKLASGFREYVMSKDEQSLGNKIVKFFKELYAKIVNWKSLTPHIDAYYSTINSGKYSEEKYQIDSNKGDNINQNNLQNSSNKINFADIDSEVKDLMKEKGITQEMFNNLLRDEQDILINCI